MQSVTVPQDTFIDMVEPIDPKVLGAPDDDEPYDCPECGVGDAAYSEHEDNCPSGFPTKADTR